MPAPFDSAASGFSSSGFSLDQIADLKYRQEIDTAIRGGNIRAFRALIHSARAIMLPPIVRELLFEEVARVERRLAEAERVARECAETAAVAQEAVVDHDSALETVQRRCIDISDLQAPRLRAEEIEQDEEPVNDAARPVGSMVSGGMDFDGLDVDGCEIDEDDYDEFYDEDEASELDDDTVPAVCAKQRYDFLSSGIVDLLNSSSDAYESSTDHQPTLSTMTV